MILIADSGATKCDWAMIDPSHPEPYLFHSPGYNPYFIDAKGIAESLTSCLPAGLPVHAVQAVYFYGSGCSAPEKKAIVAEGLRSVFPDTKLLVIEHDLLGSARALLGNQSGFAAILGTGANTCIYDGTDCVHNIDSLGYMLGDEGSGCYIGKKLLRDYLRKQMPEKIALEFSKMVPGSLSEIIQRIYHSPTPNRLLASYSAIAGNYSYDPYIQQVIRESFDDFFRQLVCLYPDYTSYTFNCVGSIAAVFENILKDTAARYNMPMGIIIKAPIDRLIRFHTDNN